jgi:hypothetical protein
LPGVAVVVSELVVGGFGFVEGNDGDGERGKGGGDRVGDKGKYREREGMETQP